MMRHRNHLRIAALAGLLAVFSAAMAMPVTWTLTDTSFTDGGVATGYFVYDADTNTIGDFAVSTSGGDILQFPPISYNPASAASTIDSQGAGVLGTTLTIGSLPPTSGQRQIRMPALRALSDSGGIVDLNLLSNAQGECYNCTPYRFFAAGELTGSFAPTITSGAAAVFKTNVDNNFNITTNGFPAPSIFVSGLLPNGLTFINNGNGTARLVGRPTQAGTYLLTMTATNGTHPDATQNFQLTVTQFDGVSQTPIFHWRGLLALIALLSALACTRLRGSSRSRTR